MFFVQFEGTPKVDAHTAANSAGAYINCWIERPTLEEAIALARVRIAEEGWIIDEPECAYAVSAETYPPGKEGREHFQQALLENEVYVYYVFPEVDHDWLGE